MDVPPQKPTHVRWLVFGLAGVTSWLLYLHRYAWGIVTPAFKAEHPDITPAQIGMIGSAFMLTYAVGQVPLGILGDWLGARLVLSVLIVLWSLTLASLGTLSGYETTLLVWAIFGVMQAGAYPLISKITRSWFQPEIRTTLQGFVTSLGRVGAACAPIILATVLMGTFELHWQQALLAIALPGVALGLLVFVFLRNRPEEHPWTNDAERRLLATTGDTKTAVHRPLLLDWSPGTLGSFAMMLFYAAASTFADMLYVYWIPTFLREEKHLSSSDMGLFTPLPLLGGALGGVLGGMLNDVLIRRLGNRRWGRSLVAIAGKGLAGLLIALSVRIEDGRAVMFVLLACKFFGDWSLPTQWGAITDMAGRRSATIFGLVNFVGSLGGMLGSVVMGWIMHHHGWDNLFRFVACVYLAAALAWLFIDCRRTLFVEK